MIANEEYQNVRQAPAYGGSGPVKFTDDEWKRISQAAVRLMADPEDEDNNTVPQTERQFERRRPQRDQQLRRFLGRHPWLSIIAGVTAITVATVASRSR
jgi:hypothetical protein